MLPYKNILVTGGAGFIGANFIRYVLANPLLSPDIIINLDNLSFAGNMNNLVNLPQPDRHLFVQGDITNSNLVAEILAMHAIDTIIHFAAESHVDRSISDPGSFIHSNIVGTYTLLEAAKKHWQSNSGFRRFHHISTDEVYGALGVDDPAFTESTPFSPRSPYSASKASSDHLVQAYFHTYGLPMTISNCSNNYGPYQHSEKLIPTIINSCLMNQPIPIYGTGKNIRDWLFVDDHVSAILCILKNGEVGETYNIGGANEWNNLSLAMYICEQLDLLRPGNTSYKELIHFVTDRLGHDFRYAINNAKIHELGWHANTDMNAGVKKTIEFYT